MSEFDAFRKELFETEMLLPTGTEGLYLRSGRFEGIVAGINALVTEAGTDQHASPLHFPLVMPRVLLDKTSYIRSFPDLTGVVGGYYGGEAGYSKLVDAVDDGEDWLPHLDLTDLALCSAACHPLYPTLTGRLPEGGRRFEVFGNCFRHEPSPDPARMQVFRQHEFVYVGDPALAEQHRDLWVERALDLHSTLGLKVEAVIANDPFFGRSGTMLAANQVAEALKIEIVSPICSVDSPTAISSANCHREHFGHAFEIELADGKIAHSACVGFGLERIALALLHTHGCDPARWSPGVRARLGL